MAYFYYKMEQSLNAIINTNVLDIEKKRPDYIYLKYSIYKESLAEIKHSQTYDKVSFGVCVSLIFSQGQMCLKMFANFISLFKASLDLEIEKVFHFI